MVKKTVKKIENENFEQEFSKKYKNAKEFCNKVAEYFQQDDGTNKNIARLCLYLGISKKEWNTLKEKDGYKDGCDYATLQLEALYLDDLKAPHPTGAIFALKNFAGYTDKQDVNATLSGSISVEQLFKNSKMKA